MTVQTFTRFLPFLSLTCSVFSALAAQFETTNSRMCQMAGDDIMFGEELLAKARSLGPGGKFTIDQDGDGDPDITTFNDNDPKHTIRPILVKVIDEDDDQGEEGYGDTDNDCWVADWYGDGVIEDRKSVV